jgi:predicted AAA+ superfamily ATPase
MKTTHLFRRDLMTDLVTWSCNPSRRPLVLEGARQVGKTALLHLLGDTHYSNKFYFNFERDRELHSVFAPNFDPKRIIEELEIKVRTKIDPSKDLVIFDEIQACNQALTSLKYFSEEMPGAHIASAGSLIGLHLGEGSFPVGKTQRISLLPLSFVEFLAALDESLLSDNLRALKPNEDVTPFITQKLWEYFLTYLVVGGMPAAVRAWKEEDSKLDKINRVADVQESIIRDYLADITKHCGTENALHIEAVLRSIPEQLAREVDGSASKFQFKNVVRGKKSYLELRGPINWLEKAGLIYKVPIAERSEQPLAAYCKENRFKLYFFDVGLLRALAHFSAESIFAWKENMYKGFFAENFALMELLSTGLRGITAWREKDSEIEFLIERGAAIVPVDIKSGGKSRSRSMQWYVHRYHPAEAFLFAGQQFGKKSPLNVTRLPVFAVRTVAKLSA